MRNARIVAVVIAACLTGLAAAVPQVLLVQLRVPAKLDVDPNVPVIQFLAQDLEESGRVVPVVWGQSDPLFRAAIEDGMLKNPPEVPNLQQAQQAASQMKVDYLFVITAWQDGTKLKAKAQLYRRGSLVWEDPKKDGTQGTVSKNQKVAENLAKKQGSQLPKIEDEDKPEPGVRVMLISSISEFSAENASRSLASTYAQLLNGDPFRSLPPRPKQNTPEPDQGQRTVTIPPPPIRTIDNEQMLAEVEASVKAGKVDIAINQLRDGIDAEPLDIERRRHLVKLLIQSGQQAMAAHEARRAAALVPEGAALWALAVRAWLDIGKVAEAQADLNEALVRDPENAEVQFLQGKLKLLAGDLPAAVASLSASIAKAPSGEALFARAIAYEVGGDGKSAQSDVEEAAKLGVSAAERLKLLWPIALGVADASGNELKQLMQQLRLNRKDAAALASATALLKPLDGLAKMMESNEPVPANKNSHRRLTLSLSLLSQSASSLLEYVKTGAEDMLSDATINLGEGIKSLNSAKELRKVEN